MGIIFQIALRNLREHWTKTLIICSLIALGMFLLVMGNSIIDTGKVGVKRSFIQSYSGDILVGPLTKDKGNPAIIHAGGPMMESTPTIPDYQSVLEYIQKNPSVATVDPQIYGALQVEIDEDWRAFVGFFGVDLDAYNRMFPNNIEMVFGHFLAPGEEGMVLPEKIYNEIKDKTKVVYQEGQAVKMLGMGSGTKIKYMKLAGVFHFKSSNNILQEIGFMDVSSLRYMLGMVVGASSQIKVAAKDQDMMSASIDNLDSFYDSDAVVSSSGNTASAGLSDEKLNHILGDTSLRAEMAKADAGAWHYVLIHVKEGVEAQTVIAEMNQHFSDTKQNLVALDWEGASGAVATFIRVMQIVFLVLVIIISLVSVIVIMNTMVVSIMERTAEIGTMRALGAQKSYVRAIFITETLTLSMVGGLIGLAIAGILVAVLNKTGLPSPQYLFEMVFGGKIMYPVLSWVSAVQALLIMLAVGLLSSIYPTRLALKITPIKAMQNK